MEIKEAVFNDIPVLAIMNQSLIEDEKADTDLTISQLEKRMEGFISGVYKAFLFDVAGDTVGYALCDMSKNPPYLRQFYICRNERRKGFGKLAFDALLVHLRIKEIDLDVYAWNTGGVAFWERLGFERRYINMRFRKDKG